MLLIITLDVPSIRSKGAAEDIACAAAEHLMETFNDDGTIKAAYYKSQASQRAKRKVRVQRIPKDWPVRPLRAGQAAKDKVTCGTCGRSWDDGKVTSMTPAPSARCPFEYFHNEEDEAYEQH